MLHGLCSDLPARPPTSSSAAVCPSKLDRLHPLVTCPSAPSVPMFPAILPPTPTRLPPVPFALLLPPVLSIPVPSLGPAPSVAVVRGKRDNKSENKKRGE